jgi:hypothetical protein
VSRVIVTSTEGTGHNYDGATGANYDPEDGYLIIVTGDGDQAEPLSVWAPGRWHHADVIKDNGPAQRPQELTP